MPWEDTENFIRSGHRDPDDFVDIKMLWQSEEKGIKAFGGKLKSDPDGPAVEQTILFDKDKWTMDRAKKWFEAHYLKEQVLESFQWMGTFKPLRGKNQIKGTALNVGKTRNRRLYSEDELLRSARTLEGKPLLINHDWRREVGEVIDSEYEDEAVEYVAEVTDATIMEKIRKKIIKHVSPKSEFRTRDITSEGEKPHGIIFVELSLIEPPEQPGDPETSIMIMESLLEQKVREAPLITEKEKMEVEEPGLEERLTALEQRVTRLEEQVASVPVEEKEVKEMAEKKKEDQPPPSPPAAQPPAQPPPAPPPAQPDLSAVAEQLRRRAEDLDRREADLKAKEEALKPPEPPKEPPKGMGVIQVEKPQLTEKEKEIIKQILIRETPLGEIVQQVKKGGKVSLLSLKVGVTPRKRKK